MIINNEQIQNSAEVLDIVSDFVNLKKRGVNYIGCCPFHDEKTASFTVSPAKDIYKCFGCGASGKGALAFVMAHEQLTYPEALIYVAERNNIEIQYADTNPELKNQRLERESLFTTNKVVMDYFNSKINNSEGEKYLTGRGFDSSIIKQWGLGYAADGWTEHKNYLKDFLTKGKYSIDVAIKAGLLSKNDNGKIFDKLRNRIVFPFLDLRGKVVGYSSRYLLDDKTQAKYMNSPENEIFSKSNFLFGLFQAKQEITRTEEAYLVEGQTDCITMHEKGKKNTVATSGTALTDGHCKLLKRFAKKVCIITDGDDAGRKALRKDIDILLKANFTVRVVILPEGEDPDTLFRKNNADNYIIEHRLGWFDYVCRLAKSLRTEVEQFSQSIKEIKASISLIPDVTSIQEYTSQLESEFQIKASDLRKKAKENTKENSHFFAFVEAKEAIKTEGFVYLHFDRSKVVSNHSMNRENTIGLEEKIDKTAILELKKLTKDIVIKQIGDFSLEKKEPILIKNLRKIYSFRFNIQIEQEADVNEYTGKVVERSINFADWYINNKIIGLRSGDNTATSETIETIAEIISYLPDSVRMIKIGVVKETFKTKGISFSLADFKKILAKYLKKNISSDPSPTFNANSSGLELSREQIDDLNQYQHYFKNNTIMHSSANSHQRISNFVITPIIHSNNSSSHFKLFEMVNEKGHKVQISLETPDLNNVNRFKNSIEAKGNFIFKGNQYQLDNIKERLYDNTVYSTEIENLGWQYEGFMAWADGITTADGNFHKVDPNGLIEHNKENYLIKPFSNLYKNDRTAFINEKKFKHKTSETSFQDWYTLYEKVFGKNAMISACSLFTAFYSDVIFKLVYNELPIINYFGPKGTGKTQQADSLLSFFGDKQPTNNISKLTPYGLAQTLKSFHNAFVLIDEYKNSLDMKWIELLKSIYNRQPKVQGSWGQQGTKTEAINVNSMVLLCGQDLPTLDVALLDRCICLTSYNTKFTDEQKENYKILKNMEQMGFAHVTDEFIKYREVIISQFESANTEIQILISEKANEVSGRIQKSLNTLLTPLYILQKGNYIDIPFTFEDALEHGIQVIKEQQSFIQNSSDLGNFWTIFETMLEQNRIKEGRNYKLQNVPSLKLIGSDEANDFGKAGMNVLFIRWQGLYPQYAEYSRRSSMVALQEQTLISYLQKSEYYLGTIKTKKFKDPHNGEIFNTSAYCFRYDEMSISLSSKDIDFDETEETPVAIPNSETQAKMKFAEETIPEGEDEMPF